LAYIIPKIMVAEIGSFLGGGILFSVSETGRTGFVAAANDLSHSASWEQAISLCSQYRGGGFEDWFLPSRQALIDLYKVLHKNQMGGFKPNFYWSSTEAGPGKAFFQHFLCDYVFHDPIEKSMRMYVRPVRRCSL